jgi:hypothetical protein
MELRFSWEAASCAATQEFSNIFFEPEVSLLCSEELSTGSYPKPYQSQPTSIHFNIILKGNDTIMK